MIWNAEQPLVAELFGEHRAQDCMDMLDDSTQEEDRCG